MANSLIMAWFFIIGFAILMYVILDGFTLGIGVLMPFMTEKERNISMAVILPHWDGNQTWLVLGGASLYGAFPIAFSTILPILYLPLMCMVITLLFRGVCLEFRLKSHKAKASWDMLFIFASFVTAFIQGVVLGSFIQGYRLHDESFHQWLSPFTMLTGIALVIGYALLGSTRLILKTDGEIQQTMFRVSTYAFWLIAFFVVIASLLTPIVLPMWNIETIDAHHQLYLLVLPVIAFLSIIISLVAIKKRNDILPYWCAITLFLSCYLGFAASSWPYIVPRHMTIWQAAAPPSTLRFIIVGAFIMIPFLLCYTGYSYYIFRGKVNDEIRY